MMRLKKFFKIRKNFIVLIGVFIFSLVFFFSFFSSEILGVINKNSGNYNKNRKELTLEDLKNKKEFSNVVQAAAGMPWQFGGTVTQWIPFCSVTDTAGNCGMCKNCTLMVGQGACASYEEVQYTPVIGSSSSFPPGTICVLKSFKYTGGLPTPGSQILGGGASSMFLWVVGNSF